MVEQAVQAPIFDLTGGSLCLDFVNTVDDRPSVSPQDLLQSYSDLVSWGQQAQVVTDKQAQQLLEQAQEHPAEASRVLQKAIDLREALFRIFKAVTEDALPAEQDLASLNKVLTEAMAHSCIVPEAGGFTWDWTGNGKNLERVIWPVVRSAADLLISDEREATRLCASETCDWLFLDTSKNQSRRWCNMKTCGNRAKARRYYQRKK